MSKLFLTFLFACGGAEAPHDHDHDGEAGHHDGEAAHHEEPHHDAPGTAATPIEAPLGAYTARLEPGSGALTLVVVDADGKPVPATGNARVMLTGTGEAPQKVMLSASGEAWTGAAKVEGAPGYLAVVSVTVGGHPESARLTWGEVPEQKPAPKPHDHGDGAHDHDEGGHGHPH